MTATVMELKGKARLEALASRKFKNLIDYISRDDVGYAEVIIFIKEAEKPGLWKQSKDQLTLKARDLLSEKTPKEKLEIAKNLKSSFLMDIVLQEQDVIDYVINLDVLSIVQLADKVEYLKFWELIQKNPHIIRCSK